MIEVKNENQLHIFGSKDHFCVYSNIIEARKHKHKHIQMSISINETMTLLCENNKIQAKGFIIASDQEHELYASDINQLLFLFDATSTVSDVIKLDLLKDNKFYILPDDIGALIANRFEIPNISTKGDYDCFLHYIFHLLNINKTENLNIEPRIQYILNEIKECTQINHTLGYFAKKVNLSEGRFSHLFKDEVGVSFNSYIVIHALEKALQLAFEGKSITESALEAGFDSPSHLSYTCAKILGMTPRQISKVSRFLKV